ncbi:MAG: cation diffusion facilitator family transporter [Bacillota bacterium]|nr:cation diffusion facilitator family transporter [Bacillota bacterium]
MTGLLIRLFIKDYENTSDPKVREAYGKMSGAAGIASNVLLSVIKVIIGVLFGSIAVIADGINNITDAGSSVITLIGFKLAGLPEDKDHPYGHARYEYITGMIVSFIIILLGIQLFKESVLKIIDPDPVSFSPLTAAVLILAILIKLWQMMFYRHIGNLISSATIIAVSKDSRNDILSTSVVLIGLIIGAVSGIQLDGILGSLVAAFIIFSGIQLIRETVSPLLGEAPDPELVNQIEKLVMSYEGVLGIHDLVVHEYGPGKIFASVHAEVDSKADVMASHDLIDCIEREINSKLGIHFVIHMDPIVVDDPVVDGYRKIVKNTLKSIDPVLKFHDFRCVPGPTHTNLIFDVVVPIKYELTQEELTERIEKTVKEFDENLYTVVTIDKDYING